MEKKRKLNVLSISEKVRLIQLIEKGDHEKCEIVNEFNIPPNTLSSIIKQKDTILKFNYGNMKKMRMTPYLDIDKYLLKWFTQCQKVLLFIDNYIAHNYDIELSSIKVHFYYIIQYLYFSP